MRLGTLDDVGQQHRARHGPGATRHGCEVAGHLNLGIALLLEGRFLDALEPLGRVMAMDSLGLHNAVAECSACEALRWIVSAYELADSLGAAERVARRWR